MDLQAVVNTHHLNNNAIFYHLRLQVHNMTFYDLKTREVTAYVFNETNAGLESSVFASIVCDKCSDIIKYKLSVKKINIYSDNCPYQNKNNILANALINFCKENNTVIEQKFLVSGHSQMEVDSVHSVIETKMKTSILSVPNDFVNLVANCRLPEKQANYKIKSDINATTVTTTTTKKIGDKVVVTQIKEIRSTPKEKVIINKTYEVKKLKHKFFQNYKNVKYVKSIRPEVGKGSAKMNEIRALQYTPNALYYKLAFADAWKAIPEKIEQLAIKPTRLYRSRRKIPNKKFQHIQELKKYLSSKKQKFYDKVPHVELVKK